MKKMNRIKIIIILIIVIAVIFISFPNLRITTIESLSAIYGTVLVGLVNQDRSNLNLAELSVNPLLEEAAQLKANDMAEKGYFAHNTPDGKKPWYFMGLAGYEYKHAGENLAVNFVDSEEVHRAWMNSRGHFLNIVNPKYTEIGIASSTGYYKGREAIFVVQMFGTPR